MRASSPKSTAWHRNGKGYRRLDAFGFVVAENALRHHRYEAAVDIDGRSRGASGWDGGRGREAPAMILERINRARPVAIVVMGWAP